MEENNTPSPKKFENVILYLTQELHCHVHVAKYPHTYTFKTPTDEELANITKKRQALASEFADAIALLSNVENEIKKIEAERLLADQLLSEEILLLQKDPEKMSIEINPQNS